ncbi:MAG: pyroglutamyl-peptidase I [Chloroflexota bacterium]
MNLLLTGFEPFGGDAVNPSEQVARLLDGQTLHGVTIHSEVLPVESARGPAALIQAIRRVQPDAVLCLGVAVGRAALSVERVAVNLLGYRIPDNSGVRVSDRPILPDGPAAYFTTLPVRRICEAVQAAGVPVELSLSAGAFLCNQALYEMLHYLTANGLEIPAGFIHLPALPEQAAAKEGGKVPSMSLETIQRGVDAAIEVLGS